MQINTLLKDVFNEEQIVYLKSLYSSDSKVNLCEERGRLDVFIGSEVRQDIKDVIESYFDGSFFLYHITYSEYSLKHGVPNLPKHQDPKDHITSLTFDYQLEANINWPICADDICHDLQDNQAMIFDPKNMLHFRPELEFKEDDYVRILFFYVRQN
jgi:hypothetical protein